MLTQILVEPLGIMGRQKLGVIVLDKRMLGTILPGQRLRFLSCFQRLALQNHRGPLLGHFGYLEKVLRLPGKRHHQVTFCIRAVSRQVLEALDDRRHHHRRHHHGVSSFGGARPRMSDSWKRNDRRLIPEIKGEN
jgi:hypothetical protein